MAFVSSIVPIASLASAQDATQDAGAPITTTTTTTATTATVTATTAPTSTPTPTQTQTPAPPSTSEQEPLRLGRFIELEGDRARARRYGSSAVGMLIGAGTIVSGALVFTIDSGDPTLNTVIDMLGVFSMIMGGVQVVDSLISFFVPSPMERLFDRYAPIAIDKSLTSADRLRRGEMMLEAMASSEHSQRTLNGVSSIVVGVLLAGVGIFIGADNDLWGTDPSLTFDRAIITTSFELIAASSIAEGVGKVVWERGAAEVAWEHWHAMHETVVVQTSKVHFTPMFGPTHNGAMAGFSLRF